MAFYVLFLEGFRAYMNLRLPFAPALIIALLPAETCCAQEVCPVTQEPCTNISQTMTVRLQGRSVISLVHVEIIGNVMEWRRWCWWGIYSWYVVFYGCIDDVAYLVPGSLAAAICPSTHHRHTYKIFWDIIYRKIRTNICMYLLCIYIIYIISLRSPLRTLARPVFRAIWLPGYKILKSMSHQRILRGKTKKLPYVYVYVYSRT